MNWKKVKLGDTATFINGYAFKPTDWKTEGLPIIRIQNLTGNAYECNYFDGKVPDKYNVKDGDILVSWSASLGVYEWNGGNAVLNQHIFKVVLDKLELDKKFMKFLLLGKLEAMKSEVHGATMQHITKGKFDNLEVNLPDLATQKHIAEVLDKADALRQQNRQLLAHYDELLQSTFIELFGDPVKNPKGWEVKNLKSISEKFMDGPFGSNLKTEHYQESGIRVIRLGNIGVGEFLDENKAFISEEHYEKVLKRNTCVAGDVIIGTMGEPNLRACILPKEIEVAVNKADCILFKPNTKETNSTYICNLLNLPNTLELASKMMHGQTRVRISMGQLQHLPIPVPPLPLQQHFAKIVEQIEAQKAQAQTALAESEVLFEGLLAGYFNA